MKDLSCLKWGMKQLDNNGLTVLDTFCGAGIGASGMLLAGFETVYAFDIKKYAVDTYNRNYGKEAGFSENIAHIKDVRDVSKKTLPSKIDVITGGFPCFTGDTDIITENGPQKIKNVKIGDFVYTHKNRLRRVTNTFDNGIKPITLMVVEYIGNIETTYNHKFLQKKIETIIVKSREELYSLKEDKEIELLDIKVLKNETFYKFKVLRNYEEIIVDLEGLKSGDEIIDKEKIITSEFKVKVAKFVWVEVKDLKEGDVVALLKNHANRKYYENLIGVNLEMVTKNFWWVPIKNITHNIKEEQVYDIEVEEDHSFIANGIAVHNCQAFSVAGKGEGTKNKNIGSLGLEFCRLVKEIKPKAFLFENVGGLITKNHQPFFWDMIKILEEANYNITYPTKKDKKGNDILTTINCWEYGVPQTRERIFVVGIRKDLEKIFKFPDIIPLEDRTNIRYAIGDLPDPDGKNNHKGYGIRKDEEPFVDMVPIGGNWKDIPEWAQKEFLGGAFNSGGGRTGFLRKVNFENPAWTITSSMNQKNNAQILDNIDKYKKDSKEILKILNQDEYYKGGYSSRFSSRNRQRQWSEPSYTIVSEARQLPLYPEPIDYDIRRKKYYDKIGIKPPRRFTVRECLRLQTVPDWFSFSEKTRLEHQYERCSGIPSLIAYKFGIEIAKILK